MKKMVCILLGMISCGLFVSAAENAVVEDSGSSWEFLQIGFWDGFPSNLNSAKAYGVRAGLPFCGGRAAVNGTEIGIISASTDQVNGVQFGTFAAISEKINGLEVGLVNVSKVVNGVQIGVVNVAQRRGVQFGLVNCIKDGWLPVCLVVNFNF